MTGHDTDNLHPNSLAAQDKEAEHTVAADLKEWAVRASQESGRSPLQMKKEFVQNERWPGQMSILEYLQQRLYELGKRERKEFLSEWLHWPIHDIVNDPEFSKKCHDKWMCTSVLSDLGLATIPISVVVDPASGEYGETLVASTAAELTDFLATAEFPLFAKPNDLLGSFGAFRIESFDGERVLLHNGDSWTVDVLIEEVMSAIPYVLQPVISNHDQIRQFAEGLATIRVVNFVEDSGVRIERAVLKIPVAGQVADNAWREGNLTANINPETGVIDRVISGLGPDLVEYDEHPATGTQLVGMALPMWDELRALDIATAKAFSGLSYQTQDIALSNDGPLVVEVNSGGSFALPQAASGRGLLTDENKRFFERCGVNFRTMQNPRLAAA